MPKLRVLAFERTHLKRDVPRRTRGKHALVAELERLPERALLSLLAAVVPGNGGEIIKSQFQPYGNGVVGTQLWDVGVRGPLAIHSVTPNAFAPPPPILPRDPANSFTPCRESTGFTPAIFISPASPLTFCVVILPAAIAAVRSRLPEARLPPHT